MLILIEIALATFAVTYLIRYTDGPFDIFWKLRRLVGIEWDYKSGTDEIEEWAGDDTGFFGSLIVCWWCLSTWVSAFWTILAVLLLGLSLAEAPFFWFGAVALAGLLKRYLNGAIH